MTSEPQENEQQKRLRAARRIVIKLGTGIVTDGAGQFNDAHLAPMARTIGRLKEDGRQVVLVSSGAVGLGRGRIGLHRDRLNDMVMRQACAAVGQSLLMHEYEKLFQSRDVQLAQVLLTEGDFVDRSRYSNLRQTMEALLKLGVLPIVNENDTVSTAELDYLDNSRRNASAGRTRRAGERIFSDNDRLAALVMSHIEAEVLVLLTDVDGLMRLAPSRTKTDAMEIIPLVEAITPELKALAMGPSEGGRGGMLTKLEAAEIAMRAGGVAVIANGTKPETLSNIFDGTPAGTVFVSKTRMAGKRRWIAYAAGVRGRVIVNAGARDALTGGKASLLASGVTGVEGEFEAAEVVSIVDSESVEFARGISDYSRRDAQELVGNGSRQPANTGKGKTRATVLVKRDNIVLLDRE